VKLFKELDKEEVEVFKQWARNNYAIYDIIKGVWHPVVQQECVNMNIEYEAGLVE